MPPKMAVTAPRTSPEGELADAPLVRFPLGLVGFETEQEFVVREDPNHPMVTWLMSQGTPGLTFPLMNPRLFAPDYTVAISQVDLKPLGFTEGDQVEIHAIVVLRTSPPAVTANLAGPVLINRRTGRAMQAVLPGKGTRVPAPDFRSSEDPAANSLILNV